MEKVRKGGQGEDRKRRDMRVEVHGMDVGEWSDERVSWFFLVFLQPNHGDGG